MPSENEQKKKNKIKEDFPRSKSNPKLTGLVTSTGRKQLKVESPKNSGRKQLTIESPKNNNRKLLKVESPKSKTPTKRLSSGTGTEFNNNSLYKNNKSPRNGR